MAITSTDNQVIYTGSGTTGPFDFDFKIFVSSDLKVEKLTIATEVSETLAETTDYTVAIDGDGTGAVTLVATLSSAYKLVITRELPLTQEITYVEGDKFPSTSHEEALDRAAMRDQQLQEQIDRCVKVTAGGSVTPDELIDSLDTAVLAATDAATAAETAQGLAESAQAAAEAAAASLTYASQAEAEAGAINNKMMSPLRTAQAIAALGFGSWASKSDNTVYQAATAGVVHVTLTAASGGDNYGYSIGYTDSSNPPTTARGQCYSTDRDSSSIRIPRQSYTFAVKKGDYYKVVQTTVGGSVTQTIFWIPMGG